MRLKRLCFVFVACIVSLSVCGQTTCEGVVDSILSYYKKVPQEKVYLHTDRDVYVAGDSLWFRAYVVDALTHVPSVQSHYVYVELRDMVGDSLVNRMMVRCDSAGVFDNALFLPLRLPDGEYVISAYTQWMRNFESELFFSKKIQVVNPNIDRIKLSDCPCDSLTALDLSLFPEGGCLVAGETQRVAFKAVGSNGYGIDVCLKLFRENGELLTETSSIHRGMGIFLVTPSTEESLYVEAYTSGGLCKRVALPVVRSNGATLSVNQHRGNLIVRPFLTQDMSPEHLALVVYGGKDVLVTKLEDRKLLKSISLSDLSEGVVTVALMDCVTNEILAERLAYARGDEKIKVEMSSIRKGTSVELSFSLKDEQNNPLTGHYSMSVTHAESMVFDSIQANIKSYLLLSSEVKEYVENPNSYFKSISSGVDKILDLLLMTQTWRRYELSEILAQKDSFLVYPFQASQYLSGRITHTLFGKVKGAKIILFVPDIGYRQEFPVEDDSNFYISGLVFENGTQFTLEAVNKQGTSNLMRLEVDPYTFPNFVPKVLAARCEDFAAVKTYLGERTYRKALPITEVELPDVEVVAKKIVPLRNKYNVEPTRSLKEGDLLLKNPSTMESLLNWLAVPIVYKDGKKRIGTVVYIDNFRVEGEELWNVPVSNVKQVEYIRKGNPSALVYGSDVVLSGAVMLFLRDGSEVPKQNNVSDAVRIIRPLGYSTQVKFYPSCYELPEKRISEKEDIPSLLFWEPDVAVNSTDGTSIKFSVPDSSIPIPLRVVLEGVSDMGKIVRKEFVVE